MVKNIWERLDSALVVISYQSLDELKRYRDAIRDAGLNVNNCTLLAVVESKKEREVLSHNSLAIFISEKDFNFLGRLKNPEAQKVLARKYDLVILMGDPPKKIRKVAVKTTSMIRVGVNAENKDNHVNLETTEQTPSHTINFVHQMLKKII